MSDSSEKAQPRFADFAGALAVVKELKQVFSKREVDRHGGTEPFRIVPQEDHRVMLTLDLASSRKVLTSPAFVNHNYFKAGLQRMMASGKEVAHFDNFLDSLPNFKEGPEHREDKKALHRLLEELCIYLRQQEPKILRYFDKRSSQIGSAYDFAYRYLRVVNGVLITHLTDVSIRRVYRAFDQRQNIFNFHFMPHRHIVAEKAMLELFGDRSLGDPAHKMSLEDVLANGMLVMGVDPMMGTLCASLRGGNIGGLKSNVFQHCPTTYVSRTCINPVTIDNIEFEPGDVVYTALAASEKEARLGEPSSQSRSLAYGVGVHVCSGKRLSLEMLEIAQHVVSQCFPDGFRRDPDLCADGAFLAFKPASGKTGTAGT